MRGPGQGWSTSLASCGHMGKAVGGSQAVRRSSSRSPGASAERVPTEGQGAAAPPPGREGGGRATLGLKSRLPGLPPASRPLLEPLSGDLEGRQGRQCQGSRPGSTLQPSPLNFGVLGEEAESGRELPQGHREGLWGRAGLLGCFLALGVLSSQRGRALWSRVCRCRGRQGPRSWRGAGCRSLPGHCPQPLLVVR